MSIDEDHCDQSIVILGVKTCKKSIVLSSRLQLNLIQSLINYIVDSLFIVIQSSFTTYQFNVLRIVDWEHIQKEDRVANYYAIHCNKAQRVDATQITVNVRLGDHGQSVPVAEKGERHAVVY